MATLGIELPDFSAMLPAFGALAVVVLLLVGVLLVAGSRR